MQYLAEVYPDSVPLGELRQYAMQRLPCASATNYTMQSQTWLGELFNLYANGVIGLSTLARRYSSRDLDCPRITALARLQAGWGSTNLTTVWHRNLDVDAFATRFIHYLNGTHTLDEIAELLTNEVKAGTLILQQIDSIRCDKFTVKANCERLLTLFARHGLITTEAVRVHGHLA